MFFNNITYLVAGSYIIVDALLGAMVFMVSAWLLSLILKMAILMYMSGVSKFQEFVILLLILAFVAEVGFEENPWDLLNVYLFGPENTNVEIRKLDPANTKNYPIRDTAIFENYPIQDIPRLSPEYAGGAKVVRMGDFYHLRERDIRTTLLSLNPKLIAGLVPGLLFQVVVWFLFLLVLSQVAALVGSIMLVVTAGLESAKMDIFEMYGVIFGIASVYTTFVPLLIDVPVLISGLWPR